ncbi:(Fe-S)-binding protein, partial [Sutterella sp.]|uniref:(Fe-S)-binding protein n=1 Tax=Sutterella sp. TaxID=1981025 RepID=UPI0026E0BBF5
MTVPSPETLPIRPAFWNVPLWGEIGVYLLAVVTVALCAWGVWENVKRWRKAKEEHLPEDPARCGRLVSQVAGQSRVRETKAGRMHTVLVLGFFFLFLGTATATLDWDVGHYVFGTQFLKGNVYLAYKLILDVAGIAVLLALAFGAWRRWCTDSDLPRDGRFALAYSSLAFIVITGYVIEALRLAVQQPAWIDFSPVGSLLARAFLATGASAEALSSAHIFLWVIHGLAALAFIASIPLTYYAHLYRTSVGIAVRKPAANGVLKKIDDIEEQEHFGLSSIEGLKWTDRAALDACVECGRCNDVCPAVRAGTPLKPRSIVTKLRDRVKEGEADGRALVGEIITHEELFSCTTCGACARACPAEIQTPDLIVEMRRHLALEQGEFPEGAAAALENTASVGNPWGLDPYERMDWAKDLDVPVAEEGEHYDVLYWVGCAASYDRRARKIARAMVKILSAAGLKFAVLAEERCHAEFARRLGEEYLYQTAAQENIENLSRYTFDRMLTACPHCFNTLGNEYKEFEGADFTVIDHSSFIGELIAAGRLKLDDATRDQALTAWHDPCYLARQNRITAAPHDLLGKVRPSVAFPTESGEKTFCCGAGGGQMWTDQRTDGKRINVIRLESLRATGAKKIATACPHCL